MEFSYWHIVVLYVFGAYAYSFYRFKKGKINNPTFPLHARKQTPLLLLIGFVVSPVLYVFVILFSAVFIGIPFLLLKIEDFCRENFAARKDRTVRIRIPRNPFTAYDSLPGYQARMEALVQWCLDNPYKDEVWSLIHEAALHMIYGYDSCTIPPSDWDNIPYSPADKDFEKEVNPQVNYLLSLSKTLDERAMRFFIVATTLDAKDTTDWNNRNVWKRVKFCEGMLPFLASFHHRDAITHLKTHMVSHKIGDPMYFPSAKKVLDELKRTGKTPIKWSPKPIPSKTVKPP